MKSSHNYGFFWGFAGIYQNIAGTISRYIASAVFSGIQVANVALFQQPKYRTQWLQSFRRFRKYT